MKYLLALTIAAIMVIALIPGEMTPAFVVNNDKAAHATAFFMLAVMLQRSFAGISLFRVVLLLGLMALSIEILQYFVPGRSFSLKDLLFDALGLMLYAAGALTVKSTLKGFEKQSDRPDKRV